MTAAPPRWLGTAEFASAAGISTRAAQKALTRAIDGHSWRGQELTVRAVQSRGGGSGGLTLEVSADCLDVKPFHVQEGRDHEPATDKARAAAARRHKIIAPALRHSPGSKERAEAVQAAARRDHVSTRVLYEWLALYDAKGYAGLFPKRRADRRQRRCFITRAWDAAVPFDDGTKARIAADIELFVRSLWAAPGRAGWRWIARFAGERLVDLTSEEGFAADARQLKDICKLPQRYVEHWRKYQAVATYDYDRKKFDDESRPRVRRTRSGRSPMEIVVCDVHPMDVLLPRPDGTTFTAKIVGSQDVANNRLLLHPVFLAKGEGVRQEHIIEATVAMTQDRRWGLPRVFYLDNGKEYACLGLVADALKVATEVRALNDVDGDAHDELLQSGRAIVMAQPYNAAAKPIEGLFAALERVFSMLPGYIGGDRMAKPTANVGQPPYVYPHGPEAFLEDLRNCVVAYETQPQHGFLDGRSPREAFNAACEDGWQPVEVEPGAMLAAFARPKSRVVRQGAFSHDGRSYTHRELQKLPAGTVLNLLIPLWGTGDAIPVMNDDGSLLCVATADVAFDFLDVEGARESNARHRAARHGVAQLRADTVPLDMRRLIADTAARAEPAALPSGSLGKIRWNEAIEDAGRELQRSPAAARRRRRDENETDRLGQSEALTELLQQLQDARAG